MAKDRPEGRNLPRAAGHNRLLVLDTIRELRVTSRADVAYYTGLTAQTISNIVAEATRAGLLEDAGAGESTGGKPRSLVRLRADACFAVGIQLDGSEFRVVLADFAGVIRAQERGTIPVSDDWPNTVRLAAAVGSVVVAAGIDATRVIGIGVAATGLVDRAAGAIERPGEGPDDELLPVRDALSEATGLPVLVDNDAICALSGEVWLGGSDRRRDFAVIHMGSTVGSAIFWNGRLMRGAVGDPGAFGRTTCYQPSAGFEPGGHGPLEAFCSDEWLVTDALRQLRLDTPSAAASTLELSGAPEDWARDRETLMLAATEHDPVAWATVTASARFLANAVVTLVNIVDLDLIVLSGQRISAARDIYREEVLAALQTHSAARRLHPFDVGFAAAGDDSVAFGAAAMVLAERHTVWGQ